MIGNIKKPKISFNYLVKQFSFSKRAILKDFISILFNSEHTPFATVTYVFCSDEYLLTINRDFLSHDYYTDIITFNLAEKNRPIIGEIYISIDRVRENSRLLGQPFYQELRRVMFHGALHLCGYKDRTKKEIALMRQKEDHYLNMINAGH